MSMSRLQMIRVVGCSGGVGASSLACALAAAVADLGEAVVLAEADPRSGGLDTTAGCEHLPGLRWGDLAGIEGPVDVPALLAALPGADVPVLAAGHGAPTGTTVESVLTSLAQALTVVVDQPRWQVPSVGGGAQVDVLVVGLTPRHLRDAQAVLDGWPDVPAGVVTRGRRLDDLVSEAVAAHLGLPLLGHIGDDPRCLQAEQRGTLPGARGGVLARSARRVLAALPGLLAQGDGPVWAGHQTLAS